MMRNSWWERERESDQRVEMWLYMDEIVFFVHFFGVVSECKC